MTVYLARSHILTVPAFEELMVLVPVQFICEIILSTLAEKCVNRS